MSKGRPTALELQRMRMQAARAPSKRLIAASNAFYAMASDKPVPEIPKERAKAVQYEHIEQVKVIKWWDKERPAYGVPFFALFAIPNAGKRSLHVGEAMRAEGMRKGAPDLMLAVRQKDMLLGECAGLFIEMKRVDGGVESKEQQDFRLYLNGAGYRYALCHGADAAIATIKEYLG